MKGAAPKFALARQRCATRQEVFRLHLASLAPSSFFNVSQVDKNLVDSFQVMSAIPDPHYKRYQKAEEDVLLPSHSQNLHGARGTDGMFPSNFQAAEMQENFPSIPHSSTSASFNLFHARVSCLLSDLEEPV